MAKLWVSAQAQKAGTGDWGPETGENRKGGGSVQYGPGTGGNRVFRRPVDPTLPFRKGLEEAGANLGLNLGSTPADEPAADVSGGLAEHFQGRFRRAHNH